MSDTVDQGERGERVLRGSLADVSYPELLKTMHDEQLTGLLCLSRQGIQKTVYCDAGRVVYATSTNPDDRLGEYLVRRGLISVEQYLRSVELLNQGKRQGAGLIELGAISADELVGRVTEQVQEILYSLFTWRRGEYEMLLQELPREQVISLNIPVEEVLLVGCRRVEQFTRIWRTLGAKLDALYAPTKNAEVVLYRVNMLEDESAVFSLVNGSFTIGQIMSMSYVSNFEVLRILWAFKLMGLIHLSEDSSQPIAPAEDYELEELIEGYNRFFLLTYDFISERLGELVDHITDRAVAQTGARFHQVLHDVRMHNHGRVEYEQIYANVGKLGANERRERVEQTLKELLSALLKLTRQELGREDEQELVDRLRALGDDEPRVPIVALTDRR